MKKISLLIISLFCITQIGYVYSQTCRTPGGDRTVVFEPYAWDINYHAQSVQDAALHQTYSYTEYVENSTPSNTPTVTLNDFISEMSSTDIGLFFIHSHGGTTCIAIESFPETPEGMTERDSRFDDYITSGINSSYISKASTENSYCICLSSSGINHWCSNLDNSIVYAKGCHTSGLNSNWNSLVALGYDETISGLAGVDDFFKRMDGTKDRGPLNTRRSVNEAHAGIDHLVATGNDNVVLSPIVLNHEPKNKKLVEEGQVGFVEFDCEMDTSKPANIVVSITGTVGQLSNISWVNNHRIEFTVSNLVEFSNVDFKVNASNAISEHNSSKLDGNNNPNQKNGVGPNGDFYNWTSLTSAFALMDFENGVEGQAIQSTIPGMEFITTAGYDWIYGDKTTNNYNIYPYNNANYWCDGNFFAWLGENQGSGRINFTGATATSVSLGTSCYSGLYLEAYDVNNTMIDSDYVGGNLNTNNLSTVTVSGAMIDHVIVHDGGNYWLIDNLTVVDLLQETKLLLPEGLVSLLENIYTISPGFTASFIVSINDLSNKLNVLLNWLGGNSKDVEFQIEVFDPNNNLITQFISSEAPISIDIPNPEIGDWKVEITGLQLPENNFPYALILSSEQIIEMDSYLNNDDIVVSPEQINQGDEVTIKATIHTTENSTFLDFVKVRCLLNDPVNGMQIDNDEFALNINPGESQDVFFNLNTEALQGSNLIYIVVDPDNELVEINKENNVADHEIYINAGGQIIDLKIGWSIISTYQNPDTPQLESIFLDQITNSTMTIMLGKSGIFWPGYGINTIGDWNPYEAYKLKMNENDQLIFTGTPLENRTVELPAGVSYMPMLSGTPVNAADIFDQIQDQLRYAFDIQDQLVYWPQGGIYTLNTLVSGRGYLVNMIEEGTVTFPETTKSAGVNQPIEIMDAPWVVNNTGTQHIISIALDALNELEPGNIIGVFNNDGVCVGMAQYQKAGENLALVVWGDDNTTGEIDGMITDGQMNLRVYSKLTGEESILIPVWNTNLNPSNRFAENGLSIITGFKAATSLDENMLEMISIYPNPNSGLFVVSGINTMVEIQILNSTGQLIKNIATDQSLEIDLSSFAGGIYYLKVLSQGNIKVEKLIVK